MRAHHNRGKNGFAYSFYVDRFPRLSFMDIHHKGPARKKAGCRVERVWRLDGQPIASLEAAIAGLASPPVLSDDESRVLDLVPLEWHETRDLESGIARALGGASEFEDGEWIVHFERHPIRSMVCRAFRSLKDKALVEYEAREVEGVDFLGRPNTRSFCRRVP
jgi:hypothetical protein